jgi:ZIP family zinc transporter
VLFTFLAVLLGIVGTLIGSIITIIIGKRSDNVICYLLALAGGVMVGICAFELVPESIVMSTWWVVLLGVICGAVAVFALNKLVDILTKMKTSVHKTPQELFHQTPIIESANMSPKKMFRAGLVMLVAITLHNIPEGLAIGAGISHTFSLGFTIAVIMALHNIPEGIAVSAPLLAGGMKKWKIILWTTVSSVPTIIGAIIGFYLGEVSPLMQALCLSIAGGAMLYIVFGEIVPQIVMMKRTRAMLLLVSLAIFLVGVAVAFGIVQFDVF